MSNDEKNIGRRAFLGMVVVGVLALFVGRGVFARETGDDGTTSTDGGVPGSSTTVAGGKAAEFRINSVADGPPFDESTWRLTVDGLVRNPLSLTFAQFKALPQVTRLRNFYCVEGWSVGNVEWGGVTVAEIMKQADIDPQATHLVFHSSDGVYTDSLTLEEAGREDTLLAHELDGALLPPKMGQPLRLVLPKNFGYKYVKWVVRVEAINSPDGYKGYWEQRGYPENANFS
jgi:DMSO/TMAO reductase YedYZ molybdopterin-dependent catalytic subunit